MLTRLLRKDELNQQGTFGLAIMPFAPIKEPLEIGGYEIWPFFGEYRKRFRDEVAKNKVEQAINIFRKLAYDLENGLADEPAKEAWIITPTDFQPGEDNLTGQQLEHIQMIAYVLAFSSINESFASSSDAFMVFYQEFTLLSEKTSVWGTDFDDWRGLKFLKPYHLDTSLIKYEKTSLCEALGKALDRHTEKVPRRIFRALEIFFHAAAHNEMMRPETRVVLLTLCFEGVLGFKNQNEFARKIEDLVYVENPIEETRELKLKKGRKTVKQKYTAPKTVWWAWDLYTLRAKIVRAEKPAWKTKEYGDAWARLEFGRILLRKLIKAVLIEEKFLRRDCALEVTDAILDPDNLDERLREIAEKSTARE